MKMVDNSSGVLLDENSNEAAKYGDIFYDAAPGHMESDYNSMPGNQQPMLQQSNSDIGDVTALDMNGKPVSCQLVPDEVGGYSINFNNMPLPTINGGYTNYNQQTGRPQQQYTHGMASNNMGQYNPNPYYGGYNQQPMGQPNPMFQGYGAQFNNQYGYPQQAYNPYQQQFFQQTITADGTNGIYAPDDKRVKYVDRVVHVPGVNLSGCKPIYPANLNKVLNQMQIDMDNEINEELAKEINNRDYYKKDANGQYSNFNYMTVNNPSYNGYVTPSYYVQSPKQRIVDTIHEKYENKIKDLIKQAVKRRVEHDKAISRRVHNSLNDGITDEDIDKLYDGIDITIPASQIKAHSNCAYFDSFHTMTEEEKNEVYCGEYWRADAEVTRLHNFIQENQCFNLAKILEDRYHVVRQDNLLYDCSAFQRMVIKRKAEKLRNKEEAKGIQVIHRSNIDLNRSSELPPIPQSAMTGFDPNVELQNRLDATRTNKNSLLYDNHPMPIQQFLQGQSEYVAPSECNPDQEHLIKRKIPFAEEFPLLNECGDIDENGVLNIHLPDYMIERQRKEKEQEASGPGMVEAIPNGQQQQTNVDQQFYDSIWDKNLAADKLMQKAKMG